MKFGTVINCIDGRVQIPVQEYLKKHFEADYYDSCTEAGPLKILTKRASSCRVLSIKEQIVVSLKKHGSELLAIVGHHDCAGNPVGRPEQEEQITEALNYLRKAYGTGILYLGLYVDDNWEVHEVKRILPENPAT